MKYDFQEGCIIKYNLKKNMSEQKSTIIRLSPEKGTLSRMRAPRNPRFKPGSMSKNLRIKDLNSLNLDLIQKIFLNLTVIEITKLCRMNKAFNNVCKRKSL